ncbi:hypothetical protein VII00023_17609 [Vibrio ichthyoenteri ATCC 700023]|uniref:MSHA pilin protein MshC n=1 Tax=Vibrio ichthyoenteri ATCC 700023 TaxID=870968 RepID=F9RYA3_9VIBR|nr:prepilin-type N-terminal cleavage/methylation domain-containing protein [Vibrio ichthyoenteri]EGU46909.1 hypothetical protein VII00023_17609 [Vibrio ichthyoenteri ATCC 700023]
MLPKSRKITGFTLVELVVTIIILSILGAVAYTRLPSISGFALPSYCHVAKAAVRRVQTQAMNDVATSSAYQIIVMPTVLKWHNANLALNDNPNCTGPFCSRLVTISDKDQQRGIRFSPQTFSFDSMGRFVSAAHSSNNQALINLSSPQEASKQIIVYQQGYVDGCL